MKERGIPQLSQLLLCLLQDGWSRNLPLLSQLLLAMRLVHQGAGIAKLLPVISYYHLFSWITISRISHIGTQKQKPGRKRERSHMWFLGTHIHTSISTIVQLCYRIYLRTQE